MSSIIIIPTYNKKDNIEELVKQVLKLNLQVSILIVDDNSPDNAGRLADDLTIDIKI